MPSNLRTHRLNERRGTFLSLDTRQNAAIIALEAIASLSDDTIVNLPAVAA
jgi:hypothetical protein